mgnify:CR=1 FL=1
MSMLPNCPQSSSICLMHGGLTCEPVKSCPGKPLPDALFLGSEPYAEPVDLPGKKKGRNDFDTNTKPVAYNFYRLPDGKECFRKVRDKQNPKVPAWWSQK